MLESFVIMLKAEIERCDQDDGKCGVMLEERRGRSWSEINRGRVESSEIWVTGLSHRESVAVARCVR